MERLESYLEKNGRITTGQMADICGITKRALRLYHEKGLLSPVFYDEETGYRYYSLGQIPRADRIARLQSLGFTLIEIGKLLEGVSLDEERRMYARRSSEVRAEQARLEVVSAQLQEYLEVNGLLGQTTISGPFLKWVPERALIAIDIEDIGLVLTDGHTEDAALRWYYVMALMREHILQLELPTVVCNQVSTAISPDCLRAHNFRIDHAYVVVPHQYLPLSEDVLVIPEGFVLYSTAATFFDERGRSSEVSGIEGLLDYIDCNNMEIRGPYMGVGNVDEEITGPFSGTFDRLRFEIPVLLSN